MSEAEEKKDLSEVTEDSELEWEELSTEHVVQDEWIDFRRSAFRFPDGRVFEPYYSYSRKSYVVIVASDEEGRYLCVRQYRQGIRRVTTEFPAGCIEEGEDPFETAKRELQEETGYTSDEWTHLLDIPSNATLADNYAYLYVAKNCRKLSGQSLDETEYLGVKRYDACDIEEMITEGKFQQAIHVLAWLMSQRELE